MTYRDKNKDENVVVWNKDAFMQGQTFFFEWSGRAEGVEAVDISSSERVNIARLEQGSAFLTTTRRPAGHLFYGDEYHLYLEISADNSLPSEREYWLCMRDLNVLDEAIRDWDPFVAAILNQ